MNIRFETNEVRLRISREEARSLLGTGSITEKISFPDGSSMHFEVAVADERALLFFKRQMHFEFRVPYRELERMLAGRSKRDLRSENRIAREEGVPMLSTCIEIDAIEKGERK